MSASSSSKASKKGQPTMKSFLKEPLKMTISNEKLDDMRRKVQQFDAEDTILSPIFKKKPVRRQVLESPTAENVQPSKKVNREKDNTTSSNYKLEEVETPLGYVELSKRNLLFGKLHVKTAHGIVYSKYLELR